MTKLIVKNDTTPSTPDSGTTSIYVDSTTKKLVSKDDAGTETSYDADQTGAEIKTAYEAEANAYTDTKDTKLSGIATGAEVNPDVISQAEAEAGTATTERIFTAQRVSQAITALGGGGSTVLSANFSYVVAAGTNGGAASTSWATRLLNTTSGDVTFSSLASNQITLDAGTYIINIGCSAHFAYAFRTRFYDITNTTEVLSGSSEYASNSMSCSSVINGVITVASNNTVFEVQQKSGLVQSNYGHGLACNFGESEIYTPTVITKIA